MLEFLGVILVLIGFVGTIVPALPGSPLSFTGFILIAWGSDFARVGWLTLGVIGLATLAGLIFDFIATHYGVKRAGASKLGLVGATLGVFIGIFFIPFGIFIAPMVGAVIGELINQQKLFHAGKIGIAAGVSIIISMIVKFFLLGISALVFVWDYF